MWRNRITEAIGNNNDEFITNKIELEILPATESKVEDNLFDSAPSNDPSTTSNTNDKGNNKNSNKSSNKSNSRLKFINKLKSSASKPGKDINKKDKDKAEEEAKESKINWTRIFLSRKEINYLCFGFTRLNINENVSPDVIGTILLSLICEWDKILLKYITKEESFFSHPHGMVLLKNLVFMKANTPNLSLNSNSNLISKNRKYKENDRIYTLSIEFIANECKDYKYENGKYNIQCGVIGVAANPSRFEKLFTNNLVHRNTRISNINGNQYGINNFDLYWLQLNKIGSNSCSIMIGHDKNGTKLASNSKFEKDEWKLGESIRICIEYRSNVDKYILFFLKNGEKCGNQEYTLNCGMYNYYYALCCPQCNCEDVKGYQFQVHC